MLMLEKMAVLFLLMFIGWLMVKLKVVSNENCKVLSAIVINIATPAMILSACVGGESTIKGKDLVNTAVSDIYTIPDEIKMAKIAEITKQVMKANMALRNQIETKFQLYQKKHSILRMFF